MAFNRFCRAALHREPLTVFGDGDQTRDFTHVTDVVRATRAAGETPRVAGGIYNIGGGSAVSVNEALMLLEGFVGRRLDVSYGDCVHGDVRHTGADTTLAATNLGYAPRQSFSMGLLSEFEWMCDQEALGGRRALRVVG